MDVIRVTALEVWAHHGVLPHERELGQRFLIDLSLDVDLAPAAASDALADTVDYGDLAARIATAATARRRDLIEAVAADVAAVCLEDPRVQRVEVTVRKPGAPLPVPAAEVSVTLVRERP